MKSVCTLVMFCKAVLEFWLRTIFYGTRILFFEYTEPYFLCIYKLFPDYILTLPRADDCLI